MADGVRSVAEAWASDLHADSGLPPVLWNARLYDPSGTYIAQADAYFPDVGLAWEIDSYKHHFLLADWDATLRRRARIQSFGVLVAHTRPRRLLTERTRGHRGALGLLPPGRRADRRPDRAASDRRLLKPDRRGARTGSSRA